MASQMTFFRLSEDDRGVVIFHIWKSLSYGRRLLLSFSLIAAGFVVQVLTGAIYYGAPLVLAGNLFLLVKGYDNRVEQGALDPQAQWEPVGKVKLRELVNLDKKLKMWDTSYIDITNTHGQVLFIVLAGGLGAITWYTRGLIQALAVDAMLLFLPHWLTGTRRYLRLPKLMVKAEALLAVLDAMKPDIEGQELDVLMQLQGSGSGGKKDISGSGKGNGDQIPADVKFRIKFDGQSRNFLGFYGQCATNDVQGKSFPYFYVVSVAKQGSGLQPVYDGYQAPAGVVKEFETTGGIETLVVRQDTAPAKGYYTDPAQALKVFYEGYRLAAAIAGKK